MTEETLIEPEEPKSIGLLSNNDVILGTPIPAIDRLKIVSDEEFDDVILENPSEWFNSAYIPKLSRTGYADNDFGAKRHKFVTDIIAKLSTHKKVYLGEKNEFHFFMQNINDEENRLSFESFTVRSKNETFA